jgi:hypothetical protein
MHDLSSRLDNLEISLKKDIHSILDLLHQQQQMQIHMQQRQHQVQQQQSQSQQMQQTGKANVNF